MNSNLYLVVLCLVSSIGLSNGLKCFNCDSHDDKDCFELNGNTTELVPEECTIEAVYGGPLSGFQLGVTTHYAGTKYASSLGVEYDCMKTEITVKRTVFENETSQVSERNVYVTRACSIKSEPDACDRFKNMLKGRANSELIFCGHCDSDGCNFATSIVAWPSMCILAVVLLVIKYSVN
ncbi:uncharacterized protein LOC119068360 [Bradysia coprophila]|uniref:uncharacterized protein LOC119068360 n=1 Tax=Bradysia coprophila TaxID=38358 RepID=UPI00187D9198|nr:uncharacterized protein LOC119068360 [Bradysia coprophila]